MISIELLLINEIKLKSLHGEVEGGEAKMFVAGMKHHLLVLSLSKDGRACPDFLGRKGGEVIKM